MGLPSVRAGLQRLRWGDAGYVCGIFSDATTHKPQSDRSWNKNNYHHCF